MRILALFLLAVSFGTAHAMTGDTWNFRTNPLGLVLGPNARLDYKLTDKWTVGVAGLYLDRKITEVKLNSLTGIFLIDYNFSEALLDSWFITLGVGYGDIKAEAVDLSGNVAKVHVYNLTTQALIGYHWFWGRFNLDAAAGVQTNSAGKAEILDQNGNRVETIPLNRVGLATDASIGVTF